MRIAAGAGATPCSAKPNARLADLSSDLSACGPRFRRRRMKRARLSEPPPPNGDGAVLYWPVFTVVQSRVISRSVRASRSTVGNIFARTSAGGKIAGSSAISGSTNSIEAALAFA